MTKTVPSFLFLMALFACSGSQPSPTSDQKLAELRHKEAVATADLIGTIHRTLDIYEKDIVRVTDRLSSLHDQGKVDEAEWGNIAASRREALDLIAKARAQANARDTNGAIMREGRIQTLDLELQKSLERHSDKSNP
jgi:hypothetical protein